MTAAEHTAGLGRQPRGKGPRTKRAARKLALRVEAVTRAERAEAVERAKQSRRMVAERNDRRQGR